MQLPSRKSMRLAGYDYTAPGAYFVTVCTAVRKQNILGSLATQGGAETAPYEVFLRPSKIGGIVTQAILDIPRLYPDVQVNAYCLMPDHIHIILSWSERHRDRPLQDIIGRMKSFTNHGYQGTLWQEGFYDHIIRNEEDYWEIVNYIQNNPLAAQTIKD